MSNIYMDNILDYYKNPRFKGDLEGYTSKCEEKNVSCGDNVSILVIVKNGFLKDARFKGEGCAISQATTSMLLEKAIGMEVNKILNIKKEDVLDMLGIELGPVRLKCALLGWDVLQKAVK